MFVRSSRRIVGVLAVCAVAAVVALGLWLSNSPAANVTGLVGQIPALYAGPYGILICDTASGSQGLTTSSTPAVYSIPLYQDVATAPVTILSVRLIHTHNLIEHPTMVIPMLNQQSQVANGSWQFVASRLPAATWAQRQAVPGAVIPSSLHTGTLYQIPVVFSQARPGDAWGFGEVVTYRVNGHTGTVVVPKVGFGLEGAGSDSCPTILATWNAYVHRPKQEGQSDAP